jgi:hypothetical protein
MASPQRPSRGNHDGGSNDTNPRPLSSSETIDAHAELDSGGQPLSIPPPPPLVVAHGCLLIPAVVAVWWLWTKRATRKACRRSQRVLATVLHRPPPSPTSGRNKPYLRSLACGADSANDDAAGTYPSASSAGAPNNGDAAPTDDPDDDDVYQTWEQVVAKNEAETSSHRALRLVRWIRGPSELERAHHYFKQKRSLESSLLRRRMTMVPAAGADPCRVSTSPPAHARCVDISGEDDDDVFSRNWDYIQDLTDIELCSMGSVQISACDDDATADSVEVISRSNRYRQFL